MASSRPAAPVTIDAVGNREAITASTQCREIRVRQRTSETQALYYYSDVASGGNRNEKYPAESHTFTKASGALFDVGEVAGYLEADSGSMTMEVEEIVG